MSAKDRALIELENEESQLKNRKVWQKLFKESKIKKKNKKRKLHYSDFQNINPLNDLIQNNPADWMPLSHNKEKQIESFYKHTYFKYESPNFLLSFLIKTHEKKRITTYDLESFDKNVQFDLDKDDVFYCISFYDIFETISNGKSLQKLLSSYLNKKEVVYLLKSSHPDLKNAVVEAKCDYFNIPDNIKDFLTNQYYFVNTFNLSFKDYFLRFIIKHNINDINVISELIDYISSMYRYNSIIENTVTIPFKNFFKRSYDNMINNSNTWHIEQMFLKAKGHISWNKSYDDTIFEVSDTLSYIFTEITTAKELSKEGKALHHCVGSYASRCAKGHSIIISLYKIHNYFKEKLLTIEISINRKSIIQVKGKYNRAMNSSEAFYLDKFASKFNLQISKYL